LYNNIIDEPFSLRMSVKGSFFTIGANKKEGISDKIQNVLSFKRWWICFKHKIMEDNDWIVKELNKE
jgi:hypothetical protein